MPLPFGARRLCSVSASQGPAVTCDQSAAAASPGSSATDGARHHAHGRDEAQPVALRQLLCFAELGDRALQPIAIDLHPLATQQHQRVGARQQRGDFLLRQCLAVERDFHLEVEHALQS